MAQSTQTDPRKPGILRAWDKLPVAVRAVVTGLFVFSVLQVGWNVLVVLNLEATPSIPWHLPAGLFYLWVGFRYFDGRWAPASTSSRRRLALRARRLSGTQWRTALAACGAVTVFIIAFTMLNYRLIEVPQEATDLSAYPWWTVYSMLIMVSITAGVSEEAGFRGYIQAPLEHRYGATVAIGLTATLFWLIHLNHPSGVARWPSLLAMGIALGALAYTARSILPAMVTHAFADSVVFVASQAEVGPECLWSPPLLSEAGIDVPLVGTVGVAGLAGVIAILAMRRLRRVTAHSA